MEDNNTVLDESQVDKVSVKQVASKWGLISGIIGIAIFLITVFGGLMGNQAISWLSYIPIIIIIVLAHKEFKNQGNGFMSYGQGLGIGTLIALISSLISSAFFYIYVKFIDSGFVQMMQDKQVEAMQDKGMSQEQIDQAMTMASKFMTPEIMVVFGVLGTVFFGFILSLIISAFTKNSNPELDV